MQVDFSEIDGGVRVLKLVGSLDMAGTLKVETKVLAHCNAEKARVLIDLSETPFVASLGMRLLLQVIKTVSARSGRIFLFNPANSLDSALDISGLGSYIFRGAEAEAVAALRSGK